MTAVLTSRAIAEVKKLLLCSRQVRQKIFISGTLRRMVSGDGRHRGLVHMCYSKGAGLAPQICATLGPGGVELDTPTLFPVYHDDVASGEVEG